MQAGSWVRGLAAAVLAVAAGLAGAGCSSNEIVQPLDAPAIAAHAKTPPLPLRVLMAPLVDGRRMRRPPAVPGAPTASRPAAPTPTAGLPTGTAEAIATSPVPGFDRVALRDEVVGALRRGKAFADIALAPSPSAEELDKIEKDESYAKYYATFLVNRAAGEHDAVLSVRLLKYDISYLGTDTYSGRYWFAVAFLLQTYFFPTWWVACEDFAVDIELEATLTAVASEQQLLKKVVRARHTLTLDEFERGLSLTGPLAPTWWLDEDHWKRAAAYCAPPARAGAEAALLKDVKALAADKEFAKKLAARYSLSIGAGRFDSRKVAQALLQAEEDATAIHDLLVDGRVVPIKNATKLTVHAATRLSILAEARRVAARAKAADLVYVTFAGFGATAQGEPLLVPSDFDPDRPLETGVTIRELKAIFDPCPARQVWIIDASFAGSGERGVRTLALAAKFQAADAQAAVEPLRSLRRDGRVIILAAGPTGQARSTDQAHGNFTGYLIAEAKSPEAKPDAEGYVTLNAIFDRVRRDTRAAFDPPQEPIWIGAVSGPKDAGEVAVPLVEKRGG